MRIAESLLKLSIILSATRVSCQPIANEELPIFESEWKKTSKTTAKEKLGNIFDLDELHEKFAIPYDEDASKRKHISTEQEINRQLLILQMKHEDTQRFIFGPAAQ